MSKEEDYLEKAKALLGKIPWWPTQTAEGITALALLDIAQTLREIKVIFEAEAERDG